jgi:hypothetical protein
MNSEHTPEPGVTAELQQQIQQHAAELGARQEFKDVLQAVLHPNAHTNAYGVHLLIRRVADQRRAAAPRTVNAVLAALHGGSEQETAATVASRIAVALAE